MHPAADRACFPSQIDEFDSDNSTAFLKLLIAGDLANYLNMCDPPSLLAIREQDFGAPVPKSLMSCRAELAFSLCALVPTARGHNTR